MTTDPEASPKESVAARRYWTLQFIRLAGILTAALGALMVVGRTEGGALGPILFVVGPLLFFAVPILLARRWKRENP